MLGRALVGRALERKGAAVVAQALPQLQDFGWLGCRQRVERG